MGLYRGTGHTLSRIVREEGIGALYRGIGPSVAAIIPEAAITYGVCTVPTDWLLGPFGRLSTPSLSC